MRHSTHLGLKQKQHLMNQINNQILFFFWVGGVCCCYWMCCVHVDAGTWEAWPSSCCSCTRQRFNQRWHLGLFSTQSLLLSTSSYTMGNCLSLWQRSPTERVWWNNETRSFKYASECTDLFTSYPRISGVYKLILKCRDLSSRDGINCPARPERVWMSMQTGSPSNFSGTTRESLSNK